MRLLWWIFVPAAAYQLAAVLAALTLLRRRSKERATPPSSFAPGVSVLKPLRGLDPNTYDAFVSQIQQRYPTFEILFGARHENDPAAIEVHRLRRQFPNADLRLIVGGADTPNPKIGVLIELGRHARYPVWIVNDSDIKVDPEYLSRIVAPLQDENIGLVTCPYRAKPHNLPAVWESLGIATDFIPSTLVAQLLGVRDFGLGSTLAFRAADLASVGGFESIQDYLADDYQLAHRLASLGKRAVLSTYTVETALGDATWIGIWRHQLRWAKAIRASKGAGYAGLPTTHAGLWSAIAFALGAWPVAAVLLALRVAAAGLTAVWVLRSPLGRFCWLAPLWDLYAFAIWCASSRGQRVYWRDQVLQIDPQGRIRHELPAPSSRARL